MPALDEYHAGSFYLDAHIVTEDESPVDVETVGGYSSFSTGTVLVQDERGRYDTLPEPWFSETFSLVHRDESGHFASDDASDSNGTITDPVVV